MATPFIGEVTIFAGNFSLRGWALCNGQLLPIAQNQALFSILGTTYGGDGVNNFALPNLQGNVPLHMGQGPGLSSYVLGQTGGAANHTLTLSELPSHSHALHGTSSANTGNPAAVPGSELLAATASAKVYRSATNLVAMANGLSVGGGGQPHANKQPYLGLTFIIALQGIFPSRN